MFVVAPQGKTTVSFSQPRAPLSAGLFLLGAGSHSASRAGKRQPFLVACVGLYFGLTNLTPGLLPLVNRIPAFIRAR